MRTLLTGLAAICLILSADGSAPAQERRPDTRFQQEQAARAVPSTERALRESEAALGLLDPKTRAYRSNLVSLYQMQGRHADAAQLLLREIEALERSEGGRSVNLASSYGRLADIYRKSGRAQEADELLQRALAIYREQPSAAPSNQVQPQAAAPPAAPFPARRTRPPPPVVTARPAPERPIPPAPEPKPVPAYQGTPARGLPVSAPASPEPAPKAAPEPTAPPTASPAAVAPPPPKPPELTIRQRQYLASAEQLDREAGELWWQRRVVEVEGRYREALRYREAALGGDHPDVAYSLIRLARLYWGASRNAEASALHRRAVALLERALPPGSQALADAFWELAGFLEVSGDYRTAQPLMAKALAIFETDSTRTNLSRRRASYATVLRELGRGEEAAALRR